MSKAKIVMASLVWLFLLTIGVVAYRYIFVPRAEEKAAKAEREAAEHAAEEAQKKIDQSSGESIYKYRLSLGLDGFSGYAVLRSAEMAQQLRSRGIRMDLVDDQADYSARLADLASGKLQMAAFPIDALLKASQQHPALPATIVGIIDETKGADALVAYKAKYPNVDALNTLDTRFVLVGDSPSETLVRLLMNQFQLDLVDEKAIIQVGSDQEVLARYKQAAPDTNEVFVTWEPVVSEMLENDQLAVLFDSSKERGYIVDALVVSRDYLIKNEPVVRDVVKSYFETLYAFNSPDKLKQLILKDARDSGMKLEDKQAERLVEGIVWKNTQENLAHFGLRTAAVLNVEDMIDRIKRVLLETGGLDKDPTGGDTPKLFNGKILRSLQADGFHPGLSQEAVREDAPLAQLSEAQWQRLVPVGRVDVPPLVYARGTAQLTESSQVKLDALIETLESFPTFYLMVQGNASSRGDQDANRKLAQQRAEAAIKYLVEQGVPSARLRAVEGELSGQTTVTFVLGEQPY